jgi:hypothetical protein
MNAAALGQAGRAAVERSRFGMAAGLRLAGWTAVTLLAALGVVSLMAFAIGSFTVPGTMLQLDNLVQRYLAADEARRAQFDQILMVIVMLAFGGLGLLRRVSFMACFDDTERADG